MNDEGKKRGGGGDFRDFLLKKALEIKDMMESSRKEIEEKTLEVSVGGGMVSMVINGAHEILSIEIDKELIDGGDKKMVEDLVRAAVNEGIRRARVMVQEEMVKLTGGLKIPDIF